MTDNKQIYVGAWRSGKFDGWIFAVIGPDGAIGAELYQTGPDGRGLHELDGGCWKEIKGHRRTALFEGCAHSTDAERRVRELFGPAGGES